MNRVCAACHRENPPGFTFCGFCGHRFESLACAACGAENPAIFRFCGNCGVPLEAGTDGATGHPQQENVPASVRNERRDVTVLFADVSGFTAMCEKMDPEEVHAVMNRLFEGLGKAIREEEGHIDKYIGDNVMALFGAPVAHEDDPFRACRAALGMQRFLTAFAIEHARKTGVTLKMRIGLHCGLVLAGGIGSEVKMDYSVLGDTVNLASRLESKAPPGGILISEELARRVRSMFEFGEAQTLTVKGKEKPVQAFVLKGLSIGGSSSATLPFIGRERIREGITTALQASLTGKGRLIVVKGELGIGKTRLVEEVLRGLGDAVHPLVLTASADMGRRPFGVVRRMVQEFARRAGQFPDEMSDGTSFFSFLNDLGDELQSYRLALWHLVAPTRLAVPVPDADPVAFRHTLERGVTLLIERLAKRDPKQVLVLDAFHLADTASAAFVRTLGVHPHGVPLTIIVCAREGAVPAIISTQPGVSATCEAGDVHVLDPLEPAEAESLLEAGLANVVLAPEKRRELLERAGGVPLFIEELTRNCREGDGGIAGPMAAPGAVEDGSEEGRLPPILRAAMMSRLDRLPVVQRGFLSCAAIQGAEFNFTGAARTAGINDADPIESLRRDLERAGLITATGGDLWCFSQPLLREACYEAMLKRDRRRFHLQTAEQLIAMAGIHGIAPETLAHHFRQGEAWMEAAESAIRAAERANDLGLPVDAERWFSSARTDLERISEMTSPVRTVLFRATRGLALIRIRRGEYQAAREEAGFLAKTAPEPADVAESERISALIDAATGRSGEAELRLRSALSLVSDNAPAADLHGDLAELLLRAARFAEAREEVGQWRGVLAPDDLRGRIRADTLEGRILYGQGNFAEALERFSQARAGAERIGALSERARSENYLGNAARDLGRHDEARTHFLAALSICEKIQDAEGISGAHNNLGNLAMSVGDWLGAEGHHLEAFRRWDGTGNVPGAAMAQANLAILAIEQGRPDEASRLADEALKRAKQSGHSVLEALVVVVQGEAALASGDLERAVGRFEQILAGPQATMVPLARFGALRGRGRVDLARQKPLEAASRLGEAMQGFTSLQRVQEAARTALWLAEAKLLEGKAAEAVSLLEDAKNRFIQIGAIGDVSRAMSALKKALAAGEQTG